MTKNPSLPGVSRFSNPRISVQRHQLLTDKIKSSKNLANMQKLWYNPSVKLCRIVGRDCSMKKSEPFNRKIFAMLIEKAKGDRSSK